MEGNCDKDVLNLLYLSFRALIKNVQSYDLIRRIFEIKMLALDGEALHCFSCVKCNSDQKLVVFNANTGGFLCDKCKKIYVDSIDISESTVYTVQYIISNRVDKLYTFNVSEYVLDELRMIVNRYMPLHIDKKFKSLEILDVF